MKLSLANIFVLTAFACLATGWYADHAQLSRRLSESQREKALTQLRQSVNLKDYYKRLDGVTALGKHGGDEVLAPLIYALGDPDTKIAAAALDALQHLTGEDLGQNGAAPRSHADFNKEWARWIDWYIDQHGHSAADASAGFSMPIQSALQDRAKKMAEKLDER